MAPKGGKGGGGSSSKGSGGGSSSSTCSLCSYPYRLDSYGYGGSADRAIFAFQIILAILCIVCMVLVAIRPWLRLDQKRDRFKFIVFELMAGSQLLYLIFSIVDYILHIVEARVTYGYFITYIFQTFFWRISDIFMLLLILRCLEGARNAMKTAYTKLRIVNWIAIGLLSLLTLIGWIVYTKSIADLLNGSRTGVTRTGVAGIDTAYVSIAFVVSLGMVAFVLFIAVKKVIPVQSVAILGVIVFAYWLSSLLVLIFYATYYWSRRDYSYDLGTANSVIDVLAAIVITAALAALSMISNKKTRQFTAKSEHSASHAPPAPIGYAQVPKQDQQSFTTDTTYHEGQYGNSQWQPNNTQYVPQTTYDPAAQPLFPTQAYNPPQQTSHVYDNGAQYAPAQQPYMHQPNMQQPQRFYGNNHAYSAVPQASG